MGSGRIKFAGNSTWTLRTKNPKDSWCRFADELEPFEGIFKGDRLLTAVYWEKTGFFKFLGGHFIEATQAYQNAVRLGIPASHLYYDLGVCLKIQGRAEESKGDFDKAEALSKEDR